MSTTIKSNKNRFIAIFLSAVMLIAIVPMTASATSQAFPYTIFAGSPQNGAININATSNLAINGSVATNGTFSRQIQPNGNNSIVENLSENIIQIENKIKTTYFSGNNIESYVGNHVFTNQNINRNVPLSVGENLELTGNISLNSSIMASGNITLNGDVLNVNNSIVIYSENGNITINAPNNNANLNNVLIYAPKGSVVINSNNINVQGVVIARTIAFNSPNVNINHQQSVAQFVGVECEGLGGGNDNDLLGDCRFGGVILPPTNAGNPAIRIGNGNGLAGTSGNDANRRVLNVDVLELISGTAIKANEIYGIAAVTRGLTDDNRQAFISVNGVDSPMFHGSSSYNPDRIWALMECHNTPDLVPRTPENRLVYMNRYGGNPQVASNVVSLAPFTDDENPPRFDVQIRANNDHIAIVTEVLLLDENENVLGGVSFGGENNGWTRFFSFVKCNVCVHCKDDGLVDPRYNLRYRLSNGNAIIVGFASDNHLQNVTIPARIGGSPGYPVTRIYHFAFEECENLREITIPAGVTNIGWGAFQSSGLEKITFEANSSVAILNVGMVAFGNCINLETIDFSGYSQTYLDSFAFMNSGLTAVNGNYDIGNEVGVFANTPYGGFISDGNDDFGDFDDEIEYRLTVAADFDPSTGNVKISWIPAASIRDIEIPVSGLSAGKFKVYVSENGVDYRHLETLNNKFETIYEPEIDGDFIIRYFKVDQIIGETTVVNSNADFAIWSPDGDWESYTRSWVLSAEVLAHVDEDDSVVFEAESNLLSRINTEDNPFALSLKIDAAGFPNEHLRVVKSGYSNVMQSDMIFGVVPELIYTGNISVDGVRLNFEIKDGIYSGYNMSELNVFKWFDEVNMSIPITTIVNDDGKIVCTAESDSIGTFALGDAEKWLGFLESPTLPEGFDVDKYHALIGTNWSMIELDGVPCPDSETDTDRDGLRDWDEIMHGLITDEHGNRRFHADGSLRLLTVREVMGIAGVEPPSFMSEFGGLLDSVEVLPILSNPAMSDSDGDGILDIYEHCQKYIIGLFDTNRIVFPDESDYDEDINRWVHDIDEWLRIAVYGDHGDSLDHGGPLYHDTVESMYMGRLARSGRFPDEDGWIPDFRGGRTALRLVGNLIELRFNIFYTYGENFRDESDRLVSSKLVPPTDDAVADVVINDLYRTARLYSKNCNELCNDDCAGECVAEVNFDNMTFEQLVAAGIMLNMSKLLDGTVYDFFPGMTVETRAEVTKADRTRGDTRDEHIAIDFEFFERSGSSLASIQESRVRMYTNNSTIDGFARVVMHEVAHLVGGNGLGDAYINSINGIVNDRPFDIHEHYGISGNWENSELYRLSLMRGSRRELRANDLEMILLAFVTGERQHSVPGVDRTLSEAIRTNTVIYRRSGDARDLRWDGEQFIPLDAVLSVSSECENGFRWRYFAMDSGAVITGRYSDEHDVLIEPWSLIIPTELIIDGGEKIPVVEINNGAFRGESFSSVVIHSGIRAIGIDAFRDCVNLDSVEFQSGIELDVIDSRVFYGTTSLRSITLPETVTTIRRAAFEWSGIRSIVIPQAVTRIERRAFANCSDLESVVFMSLTPPGIGLETFNGSLRRRGIVYVYCSDGVACVACNDDESDEKCSSVVTYGKALPNDNIANENRILVRPVDSVGVLIDLCLECGRLETSCRCCETCEKVTCICPCENCGVYPCECCEKCRKFDCECCEKCDSFPCRCCKVCGVYDCISLVLVGIIVHDPDNPDRSPGLQDALQILRFVISLDSAIVRCECPGDRCRTLAACDYQCPRAWNAALIYDRNDEENFNPNRWPELRDALAVLRFVISSPSPVLDGIWRETL